MQEACGVLGLYRWHEDVHHLAVDALQSLEHRGQDGCGFAWVDATNEDASDPIFRAYHRKGLVGDARADFLNHLPKTRTLIGHVRYATHGSFEPINAQPILANSRPHDAFALAHNGAFLCPTYDNDGSTHSDTKAFVNALDTFNRSSMPLPEKIRSLTTEWSGAYSCLLLSLESMIAFRDPKGFRPLYYGFHSKGGLAIASEVHSLKQLGVLDFQEVPAGSVLSFSGRSKNINIEMLSLLKSKPKHNLQSPCYFESIYFRRSDHQSIGSLNRKRHRLGTKLGQGLPAHLNVPQTVILGVPNSGRYYATGVHEFLSAAQLGELTKRQNHRTFIDRDRISKDFPYTVETPLEGKNLVLVDDSLVTGETLRTLSELCKNLGALSIHILLAAPPFQGACRYGVDVHSSDDTLLGSLLSEHINDELSPKSALKMKMNLLSDALSVDSLHWLSPEEGFPFFEDDSSHAITPCAACMKGADPLSA